MDLEEHDAKNFSSFENIVQNGMIKRYNVKRKYR
jgi:hypothetical protein